MTLNLIYKNISSFNYLTYTNIHLNLFYIYV